MNDFSVVNSRFSDLPDFLQGEQCERCGGPLLAQGRTRTDFIDDGVMGDYICQTVWDCYACGHEHTLGSNPYLAM